MTSTLADAFWRLAGEESGVRAAPVPAVQALLRGLKELDARDLTDRSAFGLAAFYGVLRADAEQGETRYAPPELLSGGQLTQRSVVFALGLLLVERITGAPPVKAGESDVGYELGRVPSNLAAVLNRALAPVPQDRFGNLAMMRVRLEEFLRDPGTVETPEGAARRSAAGGRVERRRSIVERTRPSERQRPLTRPEPAPPAAAEPPEAPPARPASQPDGQVIDLERPPSEPMTLPLTAPAEDPAPPPSVSGRLELALPHADPLFGEPTPKPVPVSVPESAPAPAPPRPPEPTPPATSARAAETAIPATPVAQLAPPPAPPRSRRPLGIAMAAAAIAAAAIAIWAWRRSSSQPSPSPSPTTAATPEPEPVPVPVPVPGSSPSLPAPTVLPRSASFDPTTAGRTAADRIRVCFGPDRLAQLPSFGASILFSADGIARRVYFPSDIELPQAERACVHQLILGLEAGAQPTASIVVYRFDLDATSGTAVPRSQR